MFVESLDVFSSGDPCLDSSNSLGSPETILCGSSYFYDFSKEILGCELPWVPEAFLPPSPVAVVVSAEADDDRPPAGLESSQDAKNNL